jgi:hypothetical protein
MYPSLSATSLHHNIKMPVSTNNKTLAATGQSQRTYKTMLKGVAGCTVNAIDTLLGRVTAYLCYSPVLLDAYKGDPAR